MTQTELHALLCYNKLTGLFTWRRTGKIAGHQRKKDGYIVIGIGERLYLAHVLAWLYVKGEWPDTDVDHRNTVKSENWFGNLRKATRGQNMSNTVKRSDNTSGAKGVYLDGKQWKAQIGHHGKVIHIGRFDTFEDAVAARQAVARVLHGEFYRE